MSIGGNTPEPESDVMDLILAELRAIRALLSPQPAQIPNTTLYPNPYYPTIHPWTTYGGSGGYTGGAGGNTTVTYTWSTGGEPDDPPQAAIRSIRPDTGAGGVALSP